MILNDWQRGKIPYYVRPPDSEVRDLYNHITPCGIYILTVVTESALTLRSYFLQEYLKQEAELEKERSEKKAKKATKEQKTPQLPSVSQDFSQIVVEPHFERDDVRELEQQDSHDYSQIDDVSDDEAEDEDASGVDIEQESAASDVRDHGSEEEDAESAMSEDEAPPLITEEEAAEMTSWLQQPTDSSDDDSDDGAVGVHENPTFLSNVLEQSDDCSSGSENEDETRWPFASISKSGEHKTVLSLFHRMQYECQCCKIVTLFQLPSFTP